MLALALIPPGNVLRSINMLRGALFSRFKAPSARSYFDYPVVSWLDGPPDGADLAVGAASLRETLRFKGVLLERGAWFLGFDEAFSSALGAMLDGNECFVRAGAANDAAIPFPPGIGLFLAYAADLKAEHEKEIQSIALRLLGEEDFSSSTYLLAAVELALGQGYASSWATLASARAACRGDKKTVRP